MADPRITVEINDENVTFFMSFGLLNRLVTIVGETGTPTALDMESVTRDIVLREVFLKRGKSGVFDGDPEEFSLDDYFMTPEDGIRILDWASEHVMDFFVKAVERAAATTEKLKPRIQSLQQSASGSKV